MERKTPTAATVAPWSEVIGEVRRVTEREVIVSFEFAIPVCGLKVNKNLRPGCLVGILLTDDGIKVRIMEGRDGTEEEKPAG